MNWQRNSKSYNVNEAFVLDETFPKGKKEEPIRERSDSQSSVEDDDDPVANPRGLPTQAESIDFGLDDDANKGKPCRDCLMGCFTVFVVLATMTCVAILLYFILINIVFVESDTKTLTGALTIEGSVLLNETYEPDLADPESMAYREMENEFLSSMSGSFSNSTLADIYNGTNVERFEQGSIRIVFSVFLLSAPNDADTEAEVISEVQVTIGDGIYSGFFDVFDVIEDSLEITSVNQESGTTAEPPITASTEAPLEPSTASTMYSVTSQLMTSLSTLLSTPVTSTATVAPTTIPTTTRLFSTHAPTSPSIKLSTLSTTSTQSTSKSPSTSEAVSSTSSTVIVNSTSTVYLTTKPTTIPPSSTYLQTEGTTSSTVVNLSTTSSTTIDNSTGTFHFTNKLTTISLSSTSDTTLTTITPITGISTIATTSPPTIPTTIDTVSTTTNSSLTKLTTIRQPSTDSPTSKTTPNTTSPSSSASPTSSTVIDNSTSTLHLTTKPTTIPPYSNYSQTVGTTISTTTSSTVVNMSTPSSTTIDNSKGTFHFTTKLTIIPLSSTSDTTFTTIPSITRISTPATTTPPPPTITPTIGTLSTTSNGSPTKLTTIRQPSTGSTTPNTTLSSSSSSPTSSTVIDNSTSTLHLTTKPTTIPPSSIYSQTVGTTISTTTSSTVVNMSTPSSTTTDNSKGTFHFTTKLTNIPLSSTSDTTFTTIPSTTRISTPATTTPPPPTITPTIGTVSTTTNSSLIKLTTIRQPSTDSSITTPNTTSSSSSSSPISSAAEVNITRQPKIHPALPDTCGARPAVNDSDDDGTGRIVGGTQSAKGKWPWMGSLRDGTAHQCGAVMIHQQWAITAHHCVGFFDNIVLGDNDIYGNSETSPYRVQRNVQPFSNPDFDTVTDNGDIALVFLTEPVEFNDHVQPLCINTLETEMRSFNNCFVTGWGTDDILDQTAMRYLLEASIQMFNRSVCSEWYQSFHVITNQHICAGQENGRRDACSGDSGGPLQCQDDQGIWYLLGVVSFGQDCGQPRLPGVYTRVSTQISFLSGILDTNLKL